MRDRPPIHPGEVLKEDFLEPMGITPYSPAKGLGVPPIRVSEIIRGKRGISADTALRLARFFSMEAQLWVNLQSRYDLECAREKLAETLEQEVTPWQAAVGNGNAHPL